MQLKKGQIVELEMERLAFGGAGIGKFEGMTVFVEKTLPGDKVKASFTRLKKQYAEADLVEVVQPSSDRREAKCRYFGTCGGCQLQFAPYEKQLEFKKQHVIDAFERIGKIYNPPVKDALAAKEEYYYRNKMEFSFGYDEEMNFTLGFHLPKRRYDILDTEECHLQSEFSYKLVNKVRDFVKAKGWLPYQFSTGEGLLRSLFVREAKHTGEVMINLSTSESTDKNFEAELAEFTELLKDEVSSIYWTQVISKRGQPKTLKEKLLYGKKALTEKMILASGDALEFDILPQAFFQVNTYQAEVLYSQVIDLVLDGNHQVVFDLFCGTGTIGLFMAKHVKHVYGIELNPDAVTSARANAERNKISNIDFFIGDVAKLLKNLQERPSLIVLDPPRAGLTEKMIEKINGFAVDELVYVSCNPSTLARDCNWLAAYGYEVKSIQPVDMFPQTFHIECVVKLERKP